jgi:hypothetical protein
MALVAVAKEAVVLTWPTRGGGSGQESGGQCRKECFQGGPPSAHKKGIAIH